VGVTDLDEPLKSVDKTFDMCDYTDDVIHQAIIQPLLGLADKLEGF